MASEVSCVSRAAYSGEEKKSEDQYLLLSKDSFKRQDVLSCDLMKNWGIIPRDHLLKL